MSRRVSALEDKEANCAYGAAAFGHRRRRGGDIMSQVSLPSHRHTRRLLGGHQGRRYNDDRDVERRADRDDDDDVHMRGGGGGDSLSTFPRMAISRTCPIGRYRVRIDVCTSRRIVRRSSGRMDDDAADAAHPPAAFTENGVLIDNWNDRDDVTFGPYRELERLGPRGGRDDGVGGTGVDDGGGGAGDGAVRAALMSVPSPESRNVEGGDAIVSGSRGGGGGGGGEAYRIVNGTFARKVSGMVRPDDIVWVHNYHLSLMPRLLGNEERKASGPGARLTKKIFFLRVPFPPSMIFKEMECGPDILEGMLNADVVGFHGFTYARHFLSSVERILGVAHESFEGGLIGINYKKRIVAVTMSRMAQGARTMRHTATAGRMTTTSTTSSRRTNDDNGGDRGRVWRQCRHRHIVLFDRRVSARASS